MAVPDLPVGYEVEVSTAAGRHVGPPSRRCRLALAVLVDGGEGAD
jgi:hypothetical protein